MARGRNDQVPFLVFSLKWFLVRYMKKWKHET